jgi:cathepsin L
LQHRKKYESETDEKYRLKIFMENKHKIAKHNQRFELGLVSYKLAPNKYADMMHHEFVSTLNGFNRSQVK